MSHLGVAEIDIVRRDEVLKILKISSHFGIPQKQLIDVSSSNESVEIAVNLGAW